MKFRLIGTTVPAVEVLFEQQGEEIITQSGGMSWMSDDISMRTDTIVRLKTHKAIFNAVAKTGKQRKYVLLLNEPHNIVKILF